jgi:membrane-bound PQQ-dependent dehydrogenase (glucose/quinate/shikimate family)
VTRSGRLAVWSLAAILLLIGLVLLAGGGVLAAAGGSFYYLAAGAAVLACAGALARGRGYALVIYAGLLVGTLAWALWEVGLDGWALAPRLLGPAVLGLLFLTPPVRRLAGRRGGWLITGPVLAIVGVVGLAALLAETPSRAPPASSAAASRPLEGPTEWRHWGGTIGGARYAPVSQINTGNVARLELAWRFDSDVPPQAVPSFEGTPLAADGRLYVCLQPGIVAALDPDTGRQLWRFTTPGYKEIDFSKIFGGKCRGVSYYATPRPTLDCPKRVLFPRPDGYLMAVDAATGRPCRSFGDAGAVDLRSGMGDFPQRAILSMPSSPPAIVNGVAVLGQSVTDLGSLDAPSGVIRGYDAETGALRWAWDAGRSDQTPRKPGEAFTPGTPNAWGVFSGDEQLGLVFVPTGNGPPDYYGGQRTPAVERYSASIVAIDVATGRPRWSFQTVHHDLWDYDVASQPVVVDMPGPGGLTPALLAPTKQGQIFVLDRRTGRPIDPVVEAPAPQGGAPGERTSPTQPQTTGFPSLAGPKLRERDMWGLTPLDQLWCRIRFKQARYEGPYTPVGTRDTLMYPGTAGGINWGSVSVDVERGVVIVNTLRFANFGRLIPRQDAPAKGFGGKEGVAMFEMAGTPYVFAQTPFMSPLRVPCQRPPYGTIHGLDLASRRLVWSRSLGTAAKSGPFGVPSQLPIRMGVPNMGGSVVTAGGVAFIGASQDRKLRALDVGNGRELWSASLPAVAAATPMSFVSAKTGRQYVVIAAGGHYGLPGPAAGAVLAFALPKDEAAPSSR